MCICIITFTYSGELEIHLWDSYKGISLIIHDYTVAPKNGYLIPETHELNIQLHLSDPTHLVTTVTDVNNHTMPSLLQALFITTSRLLSGLG